MSLLDGLVDELTNPLYEALTESELDAQLDFEFAIENAVDDVQLDAGDIDAILDDYNEDNQVADLTKRDESISKILDDECGTFESFINSFALENEFDLPDDDDPDDDPETLEGCCSSKACELDEDDYYGDIDDLNDDDDEEDEDDDDEDEDEEDEDDDEYQSLDSLLDAVFK